MSEPSAEEAVSQENVTEVENDQPEEQEPEEEFNDDDVVEEKPHTFSEEQGAEVPTKYITIDLPQIDKDGKEIIARVLVPVIKETKERSFRIVKKKRMVPDSKKQIVEDLEEEYDACMLVETLTQTVQIRSVQENGKVEIKEQDYIQEFFIGKERKYKYVEVEKTKEDGSIEIVQELEVEEESEDEQEKKRRRDRKKKKVYKQMYDSDNDYVGEAYEWEWEWTDEEEGRMKEEFSHIEEEDEFGWLGSVEECLEEEIELEVEEWKVMEEFEELEEEEEETKETIEEEETKETIEEEETKKTIEEEETKETIEEEATKETIEEEEIHRETLREKESRQQKESFYKLMKMFLMEIQRRKSLLKDPKLLCQLTGNLSKLVDETFKFEKLLSREHIKKAIATLNTEQIKNLLYTEVDQSHLPDEDKEVDILELDKMLKVYEAQGIEDNAEFIKEKKKFTKIMEDLVCKRREAVYEEERLEEFIKEKSLIDKKADEKEKTYYKLRKYVEKWRKAENAAKKANKYERFPAIIFNEKKGYGEGIALGEMLQNLMRHCPKMKKQVDELMMISSLDIQKININQ